MVNLCILLLIMTRLAKTAVGNRRVFHGLHHTRSLSSPWFSKSNDRNPSKAINLLFFSQNYSSPTVKPNLAFGFNQNTSANISNRVFIDTLVQLYPRKISCINLSQFPNVDIYLCGTIHVSHASVSMVQDVIRAVKPSMVMLELCSNRIDSLISFEIEESLSSISLRNVLQASWKNRSLADLGSGLLSWMQGKAAKLLGSKVGGEFAIAAKEAHQIGADIVLGDRLYDVTIQRVFDKLSLVEKMKAAFTLVWEVVTLRFHNMKNYVTKSDSDSDFVENEIESFSKYFPGFTDVVIRERDEYLAQSLIEICKILNELGDTNEFNSSCRRKKIVAIVGASHLPGIRDFLGKGGSSVSRMQEISKSSKHEPTWSPSHSVPILNTNVLFSGEMKF